MRSTRTLDTSLLDRDTVSRVLQRQMTGLAGVLLMALSAVAVAALITWSVGDPSLNHATDAVPSNFLGLGGAIFADLMMQIFGLASVAILAPVAVWGWYLAAHGEIDHETRRLGGWLAAGFGCALFLSALPLPASWPLPVGLGGIAGDLLALPVTALLGAGAASAFLAGLAGLGLGGLGLFVSCRKVKVSDAEEKAPVSRIAPRVVHRADGTAIRASAPALDEDDDFEEDETRPGLLATLAGQGAHLVYSFKAGLRRRAQRAERARPGAMASLTRRLREDEDDARTARPRRAARPGMDETAQIPGTGRSERALERALGGERFEPGFDDKGPHEDHEFSAPYGADGPDEHHDAFSAFASDAYGESDEDAGWPALEPAPRAREAAPIAALSTASQRVERPAARPREGKRAIAEAQPSLLGHDGYELPPLALLSAPPAGRTQAMNADALEQNARLLEGVLDDFGVRGEIINVRPGPVVTLYELEPAPGVKSSRVIGLADDIARSMSAISARVAVIPGRNAIGIELPNARRETVYLRELLASNDFEKAKGRLPLCLGKNIGGEPVIADLARMPHLLVAGTTGSGKSVSINTMILSVLYKMTPAECRMILIDPKMLELSIYDGIPHLLTPVVTDPKKAVVALKWAVREMEDRYRKMSKLGVRNIDGFNTRVNQARVKGEVITRTVQTGFDPSTGEPIFEREEMDLEPMPTIVVVVDEMADLMMVAGKDIEGAIQRLAQMARAAGIHLIMATQRPSVDVITGTIKANFPTRISFQVTSKIDSRTILGEQGAEQLLGQGDMLFMAGGGRITRVHGPFVADEEVEEIVQHLKAQGVPDYQNDILAEELEEGSEGGFGAESGTGGDEGEDLYDRAIAVVLRDGKASTSYIQRRLSIGYNRAATLIERMEQEGLVGPANHAGKREILMRRGHEEEF